MTFALLLPLLLLLLQQNNSNSCSKNIKGNTDMPTTTASIPWKHKTLLHHILTLTTTNMHPMEQQRRGTTAEWG